MIIVAKSEKSNKDKVNEVANAGATAVAEPPVEKKPRKKSKPRTQMSMELFAIKYGDACREGKSQKQFSEETGFNLATLNRRIGLLKKSYTSKTKPFPELKAQVDRIADIETNISKQSVLSSLLGGDDHEGFDTSEIVAKLKSA